MSTFKNFFRIFCERTTIHGFNYIVRPKIHRKEKYKKSVFYAFYKIIFSRIFWAISLLISVTLLALLIHQLFVNINRNPVVIHTDDKAVPVTEIHFPSVTICPFLRSSYRYNTEDLYNYKIFDYKNISNQIANKQKTKAEDFTELEYEYSKILLFFRKKISNCFFKIEISPNYRSYDGKTCRVSAILKHNHSY